MHPIAPPSLDYIPGPEEPQPMYREYIPLEDDHVFPAKEQPQPLVVSPTSESPGYISESDPKEDPEEYEDDESEDGPVDYPMDGRDDGDDDDSDSSGDDADDEAKDKDEEDGEEEEEHVASADSTIVVPAVKLVFLLEETEPVIPPPSTDITTTRGREEHLARRASAQALIDAVTAALPSPPLPPLPTSLCIPPPVNRKDDVPETELPSHKRLCLSTLGSKYEIEESSTTRPIRGQGVDYGFVSMAVPEIAPITLGEVSTRVAKLAELHEHDTQDLMTLQETVWIVEEEAYAAREAWAHSIGLSQAVHQELQTQRDHVYAHET
ncbi:hypothetical protein Tco_1165974 [Tanacetum coccineum]